uniref:AB hydrolase-1 domain-containing protein n=1 Tax=Parastrongyloides trichosuri TaxID=131310 RepID=A0A0N4ZIR4_PARTI
MTTSNELQEIIVDGKNCQLSLFVQGDLNERHHKTAILTVHDIGTNHKTFVKFVNHPSMSSVKANAIFLHVCIPGQEDGALDFSGDFPSLDQIGEDLVHVLEKVDIKTCVAFGEGAGANIICRFAVAHPNRLVGVCLLHCTATTAGLIETCKDKLANMQLESGIMTQSAWDYIALHKYGSSDCQNKEEYIEHLKTSLNPKNLSKYLFAYSKRTDLSTIIGSKLDNIEALLVTGAKTPHIATVYTTHKSMNKKKTTLLVVDNVSDVLTEAPENLARSFILLCKGCGVLSQVPIPGMERQRTLSSSMEEADRPRRFSITQQVSPVVQ